jgi:hypothetical protein
VELYGLQDAKSTSTPLAPNMVLSKKMCPSSEEEVREMEKVPYANGVGSLMYAMVCCRPDIAYIVGQVANFMANGGQEHSKALKHILRYLSGKRDYGLLFGSSKCMEETNPLVGFVDADYAGDADTRRSTSGLVFFLYGTPISWRSVLQPMVALSTTEAEYIAYTEAAKEGLWLQSLLKQIGIEIEKVPMKSDSAFALMLVKNPVYHARTRHSFSQNS